MRFISLLSLLTALAAASPISSPRSPNTALAPINKRFEASVPWIWRPRKADFEQFEDEGDETTPTETNADTNDVINKRNNGPWHWQTLNEVSGQFKDGADDAAGYAVDEAPGAAEGVEGGQK